MNEWFLDHLGVTSADDGGIMFEWRHSNQPEKKGYTIMAPFQDTTKYFEPSQKEYMINLRVENLEALLVKLKKEGVTVVGEIEKYDYGKFGWILDPEGNKIELWEPPE